MLVFRRQSRFTGHRCGGPQICSIGPGIGLSTEDIFGSKPYYCIGLRENDCNRFRVPAMRFCATSLFYLLTMWSRVGENKNHCVPEVPSAEQSSKRYSSEALCFGTRCCVNPEVLLRVDQRGAARCKRKKNSLFL